MKKYYHCPHAQRWVEHIFIVENNEILTNGWVLVGEGWIVSRSVDTLREKNKDFKGTNRRRC